jgi:hypothetical protein
METDLAARSTEDVLEDHLSCRQSGDIDGDLARNYADEVVILTSRGAFHGRADVHRLNKLLRDTVPQSRYEFPIKLVKGAYAFIEWRARQPGKSIEDGADSFVIENGKIRLQTIHYNVQEVMPV